MLYKTAIYANFRSEWCYFLLVLGFVIDYAWICKLLGDGAFTWRPRELSCWLVSLNLNNSRIGEKVLFLCFWVPREINFRFCSKTQWQMFLVGFRPTCWCPSEGCQRGLSVQISTNLGKIFLRISCSKNIAATWILATAFAYLPSQFFSQIVDLTYLLNGLEFYFDLFWMA